MPPVRALKNQYRGLNAHLHSLFQAEGGWPGFHSNHIADLTRVMRGQLRPMGYTADIEQSLQIRRYGEPVRHPESDVLIYDDDPIHPYRQQYPKITGDPEALLPSLPALMELSESDIRYYKAVAIYTAAPRQGERGEPVAWVELLSPSNKPGGQDWLAYREKRQNIISAGIVFVEIDYLHETAPTFTRFADYRPRQAETDVDAQPYRITVIDPRPDLESGAGWVRQFAVDEPLPVLDIPLNGDDVLSFDFMLPYNKTFEEMFYGDQVDYSQLPLNFDRYRLDDQIRILARMLAVLEAARGGVKLDEDSPLPVSLRPLDAALAQLEAWKR